MRDDILGMIKNALMRGVGHEQIIRSLVNAGYNQTEVEQALQYAVGGTLNYLNNTEPVKPSVQPINFSVQPAVNSQSTPVKQSQPVLQQVQQPIQKQIISPITPLQPSAQQLAPTKTINPLVPNQRTITQNIVQPVVQIKNNSNLGKMILLIGLLVILLIGLGATIFFKDSILQFIG